MSVLVAPFLSFLLNGLGQIYNGEVKKGVIFIVVSLVFMVMLVVGMVFIFQCFIKSVQGSFNISQLIQATIIITVSGFILCLNSLLSIMDAYQVAKNVRSSRDK